MRETRWNHKSRNCHKLWYYPQIFGADARIRTAGLRFTKPLLYQLSYAGTGPILLPVSLAQRNPPDPGATGIRSRPPPALKRPET